MGRHIYLIAGEASGDFLGAQLMRSLKRQEPDVRFSGVGGFLMQREGLDSLFPMEELSVMGVAEILPRMFSLLKRIRQTVEDILCRKPDVVVTIDAPDFSFRVVKKAKKKVGHKTKFVHYVAPTVWAWRPKRAKKIARFLDGIICLFDFEPPYFEKEGMQAISVGHPMVESGVFEAQPMRIGERGSKKLGVFFGSRRGELQGLSSLLLECIRGVISQETAVELVVPTLPHLEESVRNLVDTLDVPVHVVTDKSQKWEVFKACDAAIAVSGTVGLELAIAGVPHVIVYKMKPLTWQIIKRVIKTPYAHLANIMAGKEIVPEFIQEEARADVVVPVVAELLQKGDTYQQQEQEFIEIQQRMQGGKKASDKAANFVLNL